MKKAIIYVVVVFTVGFTSCNSKKDTDMQTQKLDSSTHQITDDMKSFISIFEIPATQFPRAVKFYQAILDIKIEEMDMQGMKMGLFPSEGQLVSGVIIKGEGYKPSADGVVIYLNGGDNLQDILGKVEIKGGKIIVPKTLIDEDNGYFAMFLDTEGNRIGLHSPN